MADLSQQTYGPEHKPLSRLTDGELQREAKRRRAARRAADRPAHADEESAERGASGHAVHAADPAETPTRVRQWYANLELPEGAGSSEVERAYGQLVRRYDPDRHKDDPERYQAALALTRSLTRAYRGLIAHLRGVTPRS